MPGASVVPGRADGYRPVKTEQTSAKALTAADRATLAELPASGWFDVAHAPVARPFYHCDDWSRPAT